MKQTLIFLLFLIPATLSPYGYDYVIIELHEGYNPYERIWEAVCFVESTNNPLAYNKTEQARGIVQIRPIKIDDYNRLTGSNIQYEDVFCPEISKEIFMWHMEQFPVGFWEEAVRRWNGSGKKSYVYLEKVKTRLNEI